MKPWNAPTWRTKELPSKGRISPTPTKRANFFADVANAAARAAGRALTCEITNGRFFDEVLKGSKLTRQIRK